MKKKILFVNDEMTLGGVSRILNTLLSMLDRDQYDVDLLVLHPHGELMQEIPDWVHLIPSSHIFNSVDLTICDLWKRHAYGALFRKILFFLSLKTGFIKIIIRQERKKLLHQQYDIEFSAKEGFCTIFTACGDSKRKLNWIQTDYEKENYAKHHMKLFRWALRKIDVHIACSDDVKKSFESVFRISSVHVIHNLIDEDYIHRLANEPCDFPYFQKDTLNLISVARFHPQKGLDRLIKAIAYLKDHQCPVRLALIGNGILWDELHKLVASCQLENEVNFLDYQMNPYPYIKKADLFVMSSLYEGYPTINIETLLCGTPILTTDVSGVKDQLLQPEDGWIIKNDEQALQEKLYEIAQKKELLSHYKSQLNDYHYDNEKLLAKICYYLDDKMEGNL